LDQGNNWIKSARISSTAASKVNRTMRMDLSCDTIEGMHVYESAGEKVADAERICKLTAADGVFLSGW